MKTVKKVKSLLAYKVFRVIKEGGDSNSITYLCGHDGCQTHKKVVQEPVTTHLQSRMASDTSLQKAGDRVSIPKSRSIVPCTRGWHASKAENLFSWTDSNSWRTNKHAVWAVQLEDEIKFEQAKICARTLTMLRGIPYDSPEGKKLRASINTLRAKARAKKMRKQAICTAKRVAQRKAKALKVKQWREAQTKRNKAIAGLKRKQAQEKRAFVAKLPKVPRFPG